MKVEDLKVALQYAKDSDDVMIVTTLPYATVGAHPMTHIKSAYSGFDWESGKFMIWPESNLQPSDEKLKETIKKMEKRTSEYFRKIMELERRIKELENAK